MCIETGELLKVKVLYDQGQPHNKTSDLHTTKLSLATTTSDITMPDSTPSIPTQFDSTPSIPTQPASSQPASSQPTSTKPPSTQSASTKPTLSANYSYNGEEIIVVEKVKAKKRKALPPPSKSAVLKKNVAMLLQGIESSA